MCAPDFEESLPSNVNNLSDHASSGASHTHNMWNLGGGSGYCFLFSLIKKKIQLMSEKKYTCSITYGGQ